MRCGRIAYVGPLTSTAFRMGISALYLAMVSVKSFRRVIPHAPRDFPSRAPDASLRI